MKNFKQLRIWQKGFEIAVKACRFVKTLPADQKFGIGTQISKSGTSIPSNIAEGSSRRSEKDYARFIEISLGSSFELETQLLIAKAVGDGDQELAAELLQHVDEEQKMLISFGAKLQPRT
jgi:four helix bundle protein